MSMRGALVVGIDDYPGAPLHGCVNDANDIAGVLRTHGDGGPNFSVNLLTAPADTVSRSMLRGSIEQLFESDCDVCLFYFSGHGLIESTGGYLVTQDAKRYDEGVAMDEILALANRSRAKDNVIFLDCCHSGALGNPAITGGTMAVLSKGLCVLTASRNSESALEKDGRGVFTSLVVDALKGGAADLRGHITPGSIYAYVDPVLGPWDQRPMFMSNVTRMPSLRFVPPPVPLAILRKICTYFPRPEYEYALDPSYEPETAQTNPANVAIMNDLRKLAGVGLVVPVGEEFLYFAALKFRSCRLTAVGHQYWRLINAYKL